MAYEKQYCTFMLDQLFFGVEVLNVQEVFRYQEMTAVPLAAPAVRGLINLRGQIITAIDLRQRLQMAPLPEDKLPMNVVVRTQEGVVSLLVDEIGDVLEVTADGVFHSPEVTVEIVPVPPALLLGILGIGSGGILLKLKESVQKQHKS